MLAHRRHHGPLVVQKALYPEGDRVCHAVVIHPPGGIAGGDRLALDVTLEAGCHVMLTTPAATKWYRADGGESRQETRVAIGENATVEYLPQETIVFDGARTWIEAEASLGPGARYAGWEIVSLGRRASGERFARGSFRQRLSLRREGRRIWYDAASIEGGDRLMAAAAGLGGAGVFATLVVAAGAAPADLVAAAREIRPRDGRRWGVTALPEIFAARYLGDHAEAAREWFEGLWRVLRPWYAGCQAVRPRLWST